MALFHRLALVTFWDEERRVVNALLAGRIEVIVGGYELAGPKLP